jgi:pimeloyl-ACP methyl ester carboxylesterase
LVNGVTEVAEVVGEMFNSGQYSQGLAQQILDDIEREPLVDGTTINIVGYSGGGQIAVNAAEYLKDQKITVDKIILLGAPINEVTLDAKEIYNYWSILDPLSWNIVWDSKVKSKHFKVNHLEWFANDKVIESIYKDVTEK